MSINWWRPHSSPPTITCENFQTESSCIKLFFYWKLLIFFSLKFISIKYFFMSRFSLNHLTFFSIQNAGAKCIAIGEYFNAMQYQCSNSFHFLFIYQFELFNYYYVLLCWAFFLFHSSLNHGFGKIILVWLILYCVWHSHIAFEFYGRLSYFTFFSLYLNRMPTFVNPLIRNYIKEQTQAATISMRRLPPQTVPHYWSVSPLVKFNWCSRANVNQDGFIMKR